MKTTGQVDRDLDYACYSCNKSIITFIHFIKIGTGCKCSQVFRNQIRKIKQIQIKCIWCFKFLALIQNENNYFHKAHKKHNSLVS